MSDHEPDVDLTRDEIIEVLEKNGYRRGTNADPDPDKDNTHYWYAANDTKWVRLSPETEEDDGHLVYGDMNTIGATLTYKNAVLFFAGALSLAKAKTKPPAFALPESVRKKLITAADQGRAELGPMDQPRALPSGKGAKLAKRETRREEGSAEAEGDESDEDPAPQPTPPARPRADQDEGIFADRPGSKGGVF